MKDIYDNLNKLCSRVDVVEGAVASLRADMREMKGKAPKSSADISLLDEAMTALRHSRVLCLSPWAPLTPEGAALALSLAPRLSH
ncbi:hypothetical protein HAX54_051580, partial [Datura stramonium]|nr:hypothetical protein [Datura stramonium]